MVRDVARGCGAPPAQVSLAWLLHRGADIVPIPGTKRRPTLEENLTAAQLTLGPDELRRLDTALPPSVVAGSRYPESVMHMNGRCGLSGQKPPRRAVRRTRYGRMGR